METTLLVVCSCFIITSVVMPHVKDYFKVNRLKPLDCTPCLSFWVMLVISYELAPIAYVTGIIIEYIYSQTKNTL